MIHAQKLSLAFGQQRIFDEVSFTIAQQERIGLVGRNGSGKSTLLKAIAGLQPLDSGTITIAKGKKIAYMPQEVIFSSTKSIIDETVTAFEELTALQNEAKVLELLLDNHQATADSVSRYAEISEQLADHNPKQARVQAQQVLTGLGFNPRTLDTPVDQLSVGWKMRIVLAKLLLKNADFYLFDEPTNHLDIVAKDWFISFLQQASCGFLLVCHERYFLDNVCTKIADIDRGKLTFYTGNFAHYLEQKKHERALREAAYEQQQREIKKKMITIERFRASASKAKMAQSMLKSLDKIERITLPTTQKTITLQFPAVQRSGNIVLTVKAVSQSFGTKKIFDHVNLQLERGEKVAVIAPNGVGKTTLFNLITGLLPVQTGHITLGHNVTASIFAQDQNKSLNGEKTVLENIQELCPQETIANIRTFLGAFLFSGDDIEKKVKVLSGGEKNRVGMVNVLLKKANLLLLDEPTNHLDIPSKEILLNALQQCTATMLFVSHDHDFVNRLATRIIELTPHGAYSYHGNYASYLYQKQLMQQAAVAQEQETAKKSSEATMAPKPQPLQGGELFELTKQSKKLENKIEKLEREIHRLEHHFAHLTYGCPEFNKAYEQLTTLKKELTAAMQAWETAQEALMTQDR